MRPARSASRIRRSLALLAVCATVLLVGAAPTHAAPSPDGGWTSRTLSGHAGELFLLSVSCPSASLCVATGTQNLIASSTDPTGPASAWNVIYAGEGAYQSPTGPVISNRQIQGISCPTSELCVAVTTLGQIYSTTDPTGPAGAWNVVELKPTGQNIHLYGVSCPSASLCVAVSGRRANRGKIFSTSEPTGPVSAWQETDLGETFDLRAVSCSSEDMCVAAGANGELVVSTDPTGGPSAWQSIGTPGGPGLQQSISCLATFCLTGDSAGDLLTSEAPLEPGSWSQRNGGASVQITGSSCASASACLAVDDNGDLITSADPTGPASSWRHTKLLPYSPEAEEFDPEHPNGLFGTSCPSPSFCAVVGSGGQVFIGTEPFAPQTPETTTGGSDKAARRPRRPVTTIAKLVIPSPRQLGLHRAHVLVRFYADGPVRRFECRVDRHPARPCRSPWRFPVGRATYLLRIRAIGSSGLRGPVRTVRVWIGRRCFGTARHHMCLEGGGELPPR